MSVTCCVLASDSTYERCCEFERIWAVPIIALPMRAGPTPAATRAGDDGFFLQARLACISVATVCFAAAAGLEGQKLGSPLIAALPGVAAAGALAYRARPALALSPPMTLDGDVEIREAPGKGEGLFASRRIDKGQFVMVGGRRPRSSTAVDRCSVFDVNTGLFGRGDVRGRTQR